jgi:hypothetical protein
VVGEGLEGGQRHHVLGLRRQREVDGDEGVSLQLGDGEVLRLVRRLPALLARDPPGRTPRHPVAEQPHLQRGEAFVVLKGHLLGEVTAAYGGQQQRKRLGADEVRGDELVFRTDLSARGDQLQEGGGIDDVASHVAPLDSQPLLPSGLRRHLTIADAEG